MLIQPDNKNDEQDRNKRHQEDTIPGEAILKERRPIDWACVSPPNWLHIFQRKNRKPWENILLLSPPLDFSEYGESSLESYL